MEKLTFTMEQKVITTYEVEMTQEELKTLRQKIKETGSDDEEELLEEVFQNLIEEVVGLPGYLHSNDEDWEGQEWGEYGDYELGNEDVIQLIRNTIEERQQEEEKLSELNLI